MRNVNSRQHCSYSQTIQLDDWHLLSQTQGLPLASLVKSLRIILVIYIYCRTVLVDVLDGVGEKEQRCAKPVQINPI